MKVKLVCLDRFFPVPEIELSSLPAVIGRGESARIRIEDRWLSRQHCELDVIDGVLVVRDLGSKHGTYINGLPIAESPMRPGDQLHIGIYKFVAEYEPASVGEDESAVVGA